MGAFQMKSVGVFIWGLNAAAGEIDQSYPRAGLGHFSMGFIMHGPPSALRRLVEAK